MFSLDVEPAFVSIGCVPVIASIMVISRILARKNFIKVKGMFARINGFLAENISGMKLVQIFHRDTVAVILFCMGRILEGNLEIGVLFAFIAYIKQFFEPISELLEKYTTIQSAIISSERVFEILDTVDVQEDMESGIPEYRLKDLRRLISVVLQDEELLQLGGLYSKLYRTQIEKTTA